jgi:hypothetical protein
MSDPSIAQYARQVLTALAVVHKLTAEHVFLIQLIPRGDERATMLAMRPGWDATRRNRNQGTAKRGHGQNNRMVVPCVWRGGRPFYEQLRSPVIVSRGIPATLKFYVESPRADCRHACSIDDIVYVLRRLPSKHVRSIAAIVLRQPTRKQAILRPVWGRMIYSSSES